MRSLICSFFGRLELVALALVQYSQEIACFLFNQPNMYTSHTTRQCFYVFLSELNSSRPE